MCLPSLYWITVNCQCLRSMEWSIYYDCLVRRDLLLEEVCACMCVCGRGGGGSASAAHLWSVLFVVPGVYSAWTDSSSRILILIDHLTLMRKSWFSSSFTIQPVTIHFTSDIQSTPLITNSHIANFVIMVRYIIANHCPCPRLTAFLL